MTYILDTNVVSELRRPKQMARSVRSWFSSIDLNQAWISVIVILELEFGAAQAAHKRRPHAKLLREWIDQYVTIQFGERVFPVDWKVAALCAPFHVPKTRAYNDALIAATALAHDCVLVTRNVADFEHFGVRLLNPWDHPA